MSKNFNLSFDDKILSKQQFPTNADLKEIEYLLEYCEKDINEHSSIANKTIEVISKSKQNVRKLFDDNGKLVYSERVVTNGYECCSYSAAGKLSETKTYDKSGFLLSSRKFLNNGEVDWTHLQTFERKIYKDVKAKGFLTFNTYRYTPDEQMHLSESCVCNEAQKIVSLRIYDNKGNINWEKSFEKNYDSNQEMITFTAFAKNGQKIITTFKDGLEVSRRIFRFDGNIDWAAGGNFDRVYDNNGNLKFHQEFKAEGEIDWEKTFNQTVDIFGNVMFYQHFKANAETDWTKTTRQSFDEKGNITRYREFNTDGSIDWKKSHNYSYDENGNPTLKYDFYLPEQKYVSLENIYDSNNLMLSTRAYNPDGSIKWAYSSDKNYDENKKLISERRYNYNGAVNWSNSIDIIRNKIGQKIAVQKYNPNGAINWNESLNFVYDERGNVTKIVGFYTDGSICPSRSFEMQYDLNGNLISKTGFNSDHTIDWTKSFKKEYDETGHLVSERYYFANGNVKWKKSADFAYDINGNQTSVRNYHSDGSFDLCRSFNFSYNQTYNSINKQIRTLLDTKLDSSNSFLFVHTE